MAPQPSISVHERHLDAAVARRRPDLVAEEEDTLERMAERYRALAGPSLGPVGGVLTDRLRVLRHLIDRAAAEEHDSLREAARRLAARARCFTDSQAKALAALIESHPGAEPEMMGTGDGTIVVSFGPRRGNGAYVVEPDGRSRWVMPARYAA